MLGSELASDSANRGRAKRVRGRIHNRTGIALSVTVIALRNPANRLGYRLQSGAGLPAIYLAEGPIDRGAGESFSPFSISHFQFRSCF